MAANKPRILYYDLETSPLKAWVWGCGEQHVRHQQLDKNHNMWGIICVTYCWNDDQPAQHIDWGYNKQDTGKLIKAFDKIISKADHIIGKNNKRFDDKMINALRMLNGLEGMPNWATGTDDLERQMRRHFRLPSQSLDYISSQLGLGGKIKMEMQDWIDIVERNENGRASFDKMIEYAKKDVEDTRELWNRLSEHFTPAFKMNTFLDLKHACIQCGSENVGPNGKRMSGGIMYQQFLCKDCGRFAGKKAVNSNGRLK